MGVLRRVADALVLTVGRVSMTGTNVSTTWSTAAACWSGGGR